MEQHCLPPFLYEKLSQQYNDEDLSRILTGYHANRPVTLRVNTLKGDIDSVQAALRQAGIDFETVPYSPEALILKDVRENAVENLPLYQEGQVYLQSLSSMLPPILLSPQAGETILDMAAAPGGKTTQIAALTGGKAQITACEVNKIRADRLRFNLDKQGASQVFVMVTDARKLDDFFSFDRILLDAPCTGSGTLSLSDPHAKIQLTKAYLEKTVKTQETLLRKAIQLLKPGHEMVYSTCSILSDENENVVKRILSSGKVKLVPIDPGFLPREALLPTSLPGTLCLAPTELYEGFFVARLQKVI
jgi:NOL1/NOP2/sun family putative RNA methylase